jgi:hypothetical protein
MNLPDDVHDPRTGRKGLLIRDRTGCMMKYDFWPPPPARQQAPQPHVAPEIQCLGDAGTGLVLAQAQAEAETPFPPRRDRREVELEEAAPQQSGIHRRRRVARLGGVRLLPVRAGP